MDAHGLKPEELGRAATFVTPCYLVVHPKGTLIWDVGQVPDQDIPDDGTEVVQQGILKAKHRLSAQLAALGYQPGDITFLAMSHYHVDHTVNANMFARSTWIVQQAEYDAMFSDTKTAIRSPETYVALKDAKRITLNNEDHDVFGDGTVIIKTAPGHTPGHQMLFVKLARFGPLLLAGDLYHLPEEGSMHRFPTFDGPAIACSCSGAMRALAIGARPSMRCSCVVSVSAMPSATAASMPTTARCVSGTSSAVAAICGAAS